MTMSVEMRVVWCFLAIHQISLVVFTGALPEVVAQSSLHARAVWAAYEVN